jgi:hypothetical protein
MKKAAFILALFYAVVCQAQTNDYKQQNFCKNLYKVFELGLNDNFESYDGTLVRQSAVLVVPGYSIKLEGFPINYADKDHRFVAKTNENMDSLTALIRLEEMKTFVGFCMDTIRWAKWFEEPGDDPATPFLKEFKQAKAYSKDFSVSLAILSAAPKVYTVVLYIKRK